MPTETGRAFTTGNFLANLAALKAINFGSADPAGVWFLLPNGTAGNVEVWVWQPASTATADDIAVVKPDSIVPGSPGRCIQQLRFDVSQLGGVLAGIALLNTAGLIERTSGGGAGIVELSAFIRTLLNDADATAARTTLGIGDVAARTIGTNAGQIRDAADGAYSDARIPLSHADTHLAGGTDLLGLGDAAFRGIGNSSGQIRDAADTAYSNARTPTTHASSHLGGADSLGLGAAAFREIGTSGGQIRDAADAAYSNARTPTAHASTHAVGGTDSITVFGYLAISINSTLTASNQRQLIDANATAGAVTINLPSAATVGSGWAIQIRKSDGSANLVTISRAGSDTINGATTLSLAVQHQSLILFSLSGTSWGVVAGFDGTLPANSLLGTGATAGIAGVIPTSTFATPASVSAAIASLVNSSPAALDTLGELAVALGNDPNFATTVTALIGTKLSIVSNLSDLNNRQTALNTLAGGVTANRVLRSDGRNVNLAQVDLTTDVTGSLPEANGGLTSTAQTFAGDKTFTGIPRIRGLFPGFWLDETDSPNKGVYLVLDNGVFQVQRRATNFGAYESSPFNVNIISNSVYCTGGVAATSTTTGALQVTGGFGVTGNLYAGGSVINFANLPTSSSGLSAGSLWRNGNAINVV